MPLPAGYTLDQPQAQGGPNLPAGYKLDTPAQGRPDTSPEQSFGAALQEYGHKMNPVSMAYGIAENVNNPIEAVKRWGDVNNRILSNAQDAYKRGDYTEAAAHALHYVLNGIPGLGEALDEAGTKIRNGDVTGGLADTAALGTQIAVGAKAPAIVRGAGAVTRATGAGIAAAAPDVATGAAMIGGGELLGRIPGMEWPARIAMDYPGARAVARGLGKGATAFRESFAGKPAGPVATPPAEAPIANPLLDQIAQGYGVKGFDSLNEADQATVRDLAARMGSNQAATGPVAPPAYVPRPPEYYGVQPATAPPPASAEAPPQPAPSASAPAPTAAAPPAAKVQPIRPETQAPEAPQSQTAADIAKARFAQAKADRFVQAIQDYNAKFNAQPITADSIADLDDSAKGVLARALSGNGLLPKVDANKFPNTSWPYIVTKLRQAEYTSR